LQQHPSNNNNNNPQLRSLINNNNPTPLLPIIDNKKMLPISSMDSKQKTYLLIGTILLIVALIALFMDGGPTRGGATDGSTSGGGKLFRSSSSGNDMINKYGLGPLKTVWGESTETELKFAVVSDLDQLSKVEGSAKPKWKSIFKRGTMKKFKGSDGSISYNVEWEPDANIFGSIGEEGRGMELSELATWQGKLLSFDDRTGIAFEITRDLMAIPRYILMEGDGDQPKGQKNEWATVKDDKLYVGSFGKEYVNSDGSIKNRWNLYVSVINSNGKVEHINWTDKYEVLRKATGASWPGYMIHEAIEYDNIHRKWIVLPRRISSEMYDEKIDEIRGTNVVLILNDDFTVVERKFTVGPHIPLRGWSTFKFIPGTKNDIIVALKTEEQENKATGKAIQSTYITVFRLSDGAELMPQTPIPGGVKFEGLEFL
jgi:soluble calcium-activated nucleotidase 1